MEIVGPEFYPEVLSCKRDVRNPTLHTSRYPYHIFWRDEVYLLFWGRSVRYDIWIYHLRESRQGFLLKYELERSSDISQMTSGTEYKCARYVMPKKGITEMRGRKDLRKEAKKGPVRWGKRWLDDPGKGTFNGEIDQNDGTDESWKRERTAENYLETVGNDGLNVWLNQEINMGPAGG